MIGTHIALEPSHYIFTFFMLYLIITYGITKKTGTFLYQALLHSGFLIAVNVLPGPILSVFVNYHRFLIYVNGLL